ncbi:metalloregulator ArsR/SmtB family transcription factor [Actinoplanes sp. N902-109]|uniref:metalloregulator ArsR/SmtB family transcription factor n=1 Tax=Actinoplanes sp. (strain N902-109) TaxID=649831 RepID=UPI00032967E9|nr:putative transcriptional regulator [Actinoplanes sp. N902-109]
MDEAAGAIADPVRREILVMLRAAPHSAGQLADRFAISRPAVSRHLRVLREAGLVRAAAEGRRRVYTLVTDPLDELAGWLAQLLGADALAASPLAGRRAASPLAGARATSPLAGPGAVSPPAGSGAHVPAVTATAGRQRPGGWEQRLDALATEVHRTRRERRTVHPDEEGRTA